MNRRAIILGGGATLIAGAGAVGLSFARMGTATDYAAAMTRVRAELDRQSDLAEIVRYATLAANGHNTQPWRFRLFEQAIHILPDFTRRTPAVDPDDHHLYVSLGCAAENLALAAAARGRPGELRFEPANGGTIMFDFRVGTDQPSILCDAIPKRQSTRADYDGRTVPLSDLTQLQQAARVSGVEIALITDREQMRRVRDLVTAGNSVQLADPAFVAELKDWVRFNPSAALRSGDGLYSGASGNPSLPTWLGKRLFEVVFKAESENEKYIRQLDSSAGVAVFVSEQADPAHWVRAGQACQRFALQATALGLKHAFINQPVEVANLRPELAAIVGMPGRRPDIVMRFGYGPTLPMSPRRPVQAVLV
jgi:nitroreductase